MTIPRGPWLATVIFLAGLAVVYYVPSARAVALETDLRMLPTTVESWRGEPADLSEQPLRAKGAHEELARRYRDTTGAQVTLYVGYYERQEQDRELVSYLTNLVHLHAVERNLPTAAGPRRVNVVRWRQGERDHLVVFWYHLADRAVANRYHAKLLTAWYSLTRWRTDGALVVVAGPPGGASDAAAEARVTAFAAAVAPLVDEQLRAGR